MALLLVIHVHNSEHPHRKPQKYACKNLRYMHANQDETYGGGWHYCWSSHAAQSSKNTTQNTHRYPQIHASKTTDTCMQTRMKLMVEDGIAVRHLTQHSHPRTHLSTPTQKATEICMQTRMKLMVENGITVGHLAQHRHPRAQLRTDRNMHAKNNKPQKYACKPG